MNWADAADWFAAEITGFSDASTAPGHRRVVAYQSWRPDSTKGIIEQVVRESRGRGDKRTKTAWVLREGIDALIETAKHGRVVSSGDDEERWSDISKQAIMGRESTIVDAQQAQRCLKQLSNIVFSWASKNYAALQLGDAATLIWERYRQQVDQFLAGPNFGGHMGAIADGLSSTEPQRWREAMWSTRDLLHDVAEYVWKDPRKIYKHLPDDDGKPIEVTADKFVNRLMAYMHQKGITSTLGVALRAEWARLRGLNSLASSAHDKTAVTLEDAKLTFFATYMLLGELVQRTDCKPVETYK